LTGREEQVIHSKRKIGEEELFEKGGEGSLHEREEPEKVEIVMLIQERSLPRGGRSVGFFP